MTDVFRPGGERERVPPHSHDAPDIEGIFNFLRALKALIDGDLTVTGFLRTVAGPNGQYIEIRPELGALVPSLQFFTGQGFSQSEPFIEIEDQGGGVWALKFIGPVGTTATDESILRLHSNGKVELAGADQVVLVVGGSEVGRVDSNGYKGPVVGAPTLDIQADITGTPIPAYLYATTVYFTADDTFDKGDYPGLRAVRVKCQGGGGGGGAATSFPTLGGGGGGGGYAEAFILVSDLDTSEAITVGAGGAGGTTGAGTAGDDSVFDTVSGDVTGEGGNGGTLNGAGVGAGGSGTGDLVLPGGTGSSGRSDTSTATGNGDGGDSHLGHGGPQGAAGGSGNAGVDHGGGGGGGHASNATDRSGGAGGDGLVIVDLFY